MASNATPVKPMVSHNGASAPVAGRCTLTNTLPEYHEVLAKVTKRALAELLGEKVEEEDEEEELDAIIMEELDERGHVVSEGESTLDGFQEDDVEDGFED